MTQRREHGDFVLLAAVRIGLLIVLWTFLPQGASRNENFDYFCCYEPSARNLVSGRGFVYDNGAFADLYPPGYPLVVAIAIWMGKAIGIVNAHRVITSLFDIVTVFSVYGAVELIGSRRWARSAGLCVATFPFFIWLAKQPNSETPFICALAVATYCFVKAGASERPFLWAAGVGIATGLAGMFRSIGVGVVVAFCIGIIVHTREPRLRRRIALAGMMMFADLVVIAPWELILVEKGGFALLSRNAGNSLFDGLTFGIQHPESGEPVNMSPALRGLMERAQAHSSQIRKGQGAVAFLYREYELDRSVVLELLSLKLRRAWYATYSRRAESQTAVLLLLYMILAVYGLWFAGKSRRALAVALVLNTLYFWLVTAIVMPLFRYMVPAVTLLMIFVSAAALKLIDGVTRTRGGSRSG